MILCSHSPQLKRSMQLHICTREGAISQTQGAERLTEENYVTCINRQTPINSSDTTCVGSQLTGNCCVSAGSEAFPTLTTLSVGAIPLLICAKISTERYSAMKNLIPLLLLSYSTKGAKCSKLWPVQGALLYYYFASSPCCASPEVSFLHQVPQFDSFHSFWKVLFLIFALLCCFHSNIVAIKKISLFISTN